MKNFLIIISVGLLAAVAMLFATHLTLVSIDSQTAATSQALSNILANLKTQNLVKQQQATVNAFQFTRTLKLGSTGADVKQLQIFLNSDPTTLVAKTGVGSSGHESTYYGPVTSKAVSKFQLKYKAEILTPNHLTSPTGLVGTATLKKLNSLLLLARANKTPSQTGIVSIQNSTTTVHLITPVVVYSGGGGGGSSGGSGSSGGGGGSTPTTPVIPPSCTAPTITSSLTASATVGSAFSYTITATGDATITYTTGSLPGGLSFSSPTISGTPTTAGSPTISITATNSCGSNTKSLVLTIIAPIIGYGATADQGQTDDPLTDNVTYAGSTYYIDCNAGDDTKDGLSPGTAWKTVQKVATKTSVGYWDTVAANENTIPQFHDPWTAASSSSAFLFKRGCTWNGYLVVHPYNLPDSSHPGYGYYSQNFTFGAYGDRSQPRPIISRTVNDGNGSSVFLSNDHEFALRNLHLISTVVDYSQGINVGGSPNSTIQNVYVEGASADGILADGADNLTIDNSTFYNNQNGGNRGGGFAGGGANLRITNSSFINNGTDQIGSHNIYARHLATTLFQGNLLQGGGNEGLVIHGTSTDVTIRGNDFVGNSNGLMVSGYNQGDVFNNFLIEKNIIHDNGYRAGEQGYGIMLQSMTNTIVRNNLVYNNRLGSLNISGGYADDVQSNNVQVYNNLFYDPVSSYGAEITGLQTNLSIKNNIFEYLSNVGYQYALTKDSSLSDNQLHLDYNLYYAPNRGDSNLISWNGSATSTAGLASSTLAEVHGLTANPLFVSENTPDFHLQAGSPAINTGATLSAVTDDFSGTSRPQSTAYDIGPYERVGF